MVQMTSYLHHKCIPVGKTFSEILVKIRHDDVTWHHMTSFSYFLLKKCWRQQKWLKMGHPLNIFWIELHNSIDLRGQPLFYDKWFTSYRIFSFCRIFDDVIDKNADVSRKKCHFMIFLLTSYRGGIELISRQVWGHRSKK